MTLAKNDFRITGDFQVLNVVKFTLFVLFTLPFWPALVFASKTPTISLHYMDRPPYAVTGSNGQPTGVVASPAEKVFKIAKVPFVWMRTPVNRQFATIKENKGFDCALGFEKTTERAEFGKFTETIYTGQPLVALINPRIKVKNGVTLTEMLSKYNILVKENLTQGDELTRIISQSPNRILTSVESVQMVQMIAHGHADFMMISNEEVDYFLKHGILDSKDIRVLALPDVKRRFNRRIMCSKSVDDKIITKLDKAIAKLNHL